MSGVVRPNPRSITPPYLSRVRVMGGVTISLTSNKSKPPSQTMRSSLSSTTSPNCHSIQNSTRRDTSTTCQNSLPISHRDLFALGSQGGVVILRSIICLSSGLTVKAA